MPVILGFWKFFEYLYSIGVRKTSLNVLMDIVIIYYIKYELDEFELNGMNVYVWYDIVSTFVNYVVCDQDIVSSGKEILVLRLLGCALFGDSIYLRRYPDSIGTLDSYR